MQSMPVFNPFRNIMDRTVDSYRIGLFIPMSGDAGIFGVSCRACAELAVNELNSKGGIQGREVKLVIEDASNGDVEEIVHKAELLVEDNQIDAIVGMHTSDVRNRFESAQLHDIPYIFTPLWEGGGGRSPTLYIGETPQQNLLPAMRWMIDRYNLRSWVMIGHDYIWPRLAHSLAREILSQRHLNVLDEHYISFEVSDFSFILQRLTDLKPDAVLVSLVGQGGVEFNRQFAEAGLDESILRLSPAVEENMLLAMGDENTNGLFTSGGYFSHMKTPSNGDFLERYHNFHGDWAPPIGAIGHSVYEGVYALRDHLASSMLDFSDNSQVIHFAGARKGIYLPNNMTRIEDIFIAEAAGINFETAKRFSIL
jgi:ABC-type branched-subunit amino acid transport system substrate-binding protein